MVPCIYVYMSVFLLISYHCKFIGSRFITVFSDKFPNSENKLVFHKSGKNLQQPHTNLVQEFNLLAFHFSMLRFNNHRYCPALTSTLAKKSSFVKNVFVIKLTKITLQLTEIALKLTEKHFLTIGLSRDGVGMLYTMRNDT